MVVDYDGRVFRAMDGSVPVPDASVGYYFQKDDVVWAEYSGALVRIGRFVGTCRPDGTIDAAYCQVGASGEVVAGTCVSVPEMLPDGRIRLTEHWRRADGTSGVSVIDEIPGEGLR